MDKVFMASKTIKIRPSVSEQRQVPPAIVELRNEEARLRNNLPIETPVADQRITVAQPATSETVNG
jgi:hypothetical protein